MDKANVYPTMLHDVVSLILMLQRNSGHILPNSIQDHTRLSDTIKTFQDNTRPYLTQKDFPRPYKTIKEHKRKSNTIQDHLRPYKTNTRY